MLVDTPLITSSCIHSRQSVKCQFLALPFPSIILLTDDFFFFSFISADDKENEAVPGKFVHCVATFCDL